VKRAFVEITGESPLRIHNRFPHLDGFTKNGVLQDGAAKDDGYLLLSAYDNKRKQSTVKLVRISDQKVLHEWVPNIRKLADSQKTESEFSNLFDIKASRYRMLHPLLLGDGGIVFQSDGPLFKINACSEIEWTTDGVFHHAIEKDADGNIWVSSVIEPSSYDKTTFTRYRDDAIAKVSPRGDVLFKKSVSKILEENGYRGLLFGAGPYDDDPIHLNDIQPALYSTQYWEKHDILLSLRHRSTVLLYRPSTNEIIWLKIGPWLNQHDPGFVGQSKISVFGNDVLRSRSRKPHIDGHNNIYLFDFVDGSVSTPYSEVLKDLDVRTVTEGRQDILDNGDVLVEESNYGRILRISRKQAIWEFTVKIDDNFTGMMNWSRYLTKEQIRNVLPVLNKAKCP